MNFSCKANANLSQCNPTFILNHSNKASVLNKADFKIPPSNRPVKKKGGQNPRNSFSCFFLHIRTNIYSRKCVADFFFSVVVAAVTSFRNVNKMRHIQTANKNNNYNMNTRSKETLVQQHNRRYNFVYSVITLNTWSQFKIARCYAFCQCVNCILYNMKSAKLVVLWRRKKWGISDT